MESDIIIALLSLLGTAFGTFGGIYTSGKLTTYRISQLEEKVNKHNTVAEKIPVIEKEIDVLHQKVDDLKDAIVSAGKKHNDN